MVFHDICVLSLKQHAATSAAVAALLHYATLPTLQATICAWNLELYEHEGVWHVQIYISSLNFGSTNQPATLSEPRCTKIIIPQVTACQVDACRCPSFPKLLWKVATFAMQRFKNLKES